MNPKDSPSPTAEAIPWQKLVAKYQGARPRQSLWQLVNTTLPFFALLYLMYRSLEVGYWLTLLLALPTAGFLVRLFIIQHDSGHGSFFKTRKANDAVGIFCSLFTWTPYHYWQKSHAIHHATAGNLDQRGIGDIYTMTVKEYQQQSRWGRLKYRLYRNPILLFGVVPTLLFVVFYRFPLAKTEAMKKVRASVYWTNLAIALLVGGAIGLVGWQAFLLVYAPVMILAATAGTWLFYVQHQFENTYWAKSDTWKYELAALRGSSFYRLPRILQWFTGNIGFHHIHHLSPRIPNYLLEQCHRENEIFQKAVTLTLRSSLKCIFLALWDEEENRLISFREWRARYATA